MFQPRDFHTDPATGKITGNKVPAGLFARISGRSHTVEATEYGRLGEDVLIVAYEVPGLHADEGPPVGTSATADSSSMRPPRRTVRARRQTFELARTDLERASLPCPAAPSQP